MLKGCYNLTMKDNENIEDNNSEIKISSVAGLEALHYGQNMISSVKPGEIGSKFNAKSVPFRSPGSMTDPNMKTI